MHRIPATFLRPCWALHLTTFGFVVGFLFIKRQEKQVQLVQAIVLYTVPFFFASVFLAKLADSFRGKVGRN